MLVVVWADSAKQVGLRVPSGLGMPLVLSRWRVMRVGIAGISIVVFACSVVVHVVAAAIASGFVLGEALWAVESVTNSPISGYFSPSSASH